MNSEKTTSQFNLALSLTNEEREKSEDLNVGFDSENLTWEVIVRYYGDISFLAEKYNAVITYLSGGYAILEVPEKVIDYLIQEEEIIYVEKPNQVYVEVAQAKREACILPLYRPPFELSGKGTLVGVIDSGIDYSHPDFRNDDGTTRIYAIWDQTAGKENANPPEGFSYGTVYLEKEINRALTFPLSDRRRIVPETDVSGHGTFVAGVAAGNGRASEGRYQGVAYEAQLLVVKLRNTSKSGNSKTTEIMTAVEWLIRMAGKLNKPLALNLSFGNNYGSHDGRSLLETYLDTVLLRIPASMAIGTGNEGDSARHVSGILMNGQIKENRLYIAPNEHTMNLQIWKNYEDQFDVFLIAPNGKMIGPFREEKMMQRFTVADTDLFAVYDEPRPYQMAQELFLEFLPQNDFILSGEWIVRMVPIEIVQGDYHMWIPVKGAVSPNTRFLDATLESTLTIPSTAQYPIAVGAYDASTDRIAPFSGRGYTRVNDIKPDIVAPGVNIVSCSPGGGYVTRSGTSMATPFVTGSAALMMQYGIVNGKDPFLYGEKLKSYLLRSAGRNPAFAPYPNSVWGDDGNLVLKRFFTL